jgi:broad specificity phosphatase PhoE
MEMKLYPDLHEIIHPNALYGATQHDPIYQQYEVEKKKNVNNFDWRFKEEGESLRDVVSRAISVKNNLISLYSDKNIMLVSHAYFIRAFIAACILGDDYDEPSLMRLFRSLSCGHASITVVDFAPDQSCHLLQLDNTNHLAE